MSTNDYAQQQTSQNHPSREKAPRENAPRENRSLRPSPFLMMTEAMRATLDIAALIPSAALLNSAPRGDGHPVMVIPGFMASDSSTYVLRRFLRSLGYEVHGWGLGRNTGPRDGLRTKLFERLNEISNLHDQKKVTVIGQSLGGIYTRIIAHQMPDMVRQIIMLGSPFAGTKNTARPVQMLFRWASGIKKDEHIPPEIRRQFSQNPPVPATAIYSKLDGITHWRSCIHKLSAEELAKDSQVENLEVVCSHVGMAFNPAVLYAVADRLALPEGAWQPFAKSKANTRLVYPKPEAVKQDKSEAA